MKRNLLLIFAFTFVLFSCSDKYKKVSDDKFIGTWELKGNSMLEGIQINIFKENNELKGIICKQNQNKYVKMFTDSADVWISSIKRVSNFKFKITENKVGKDLFSIYGQKTSEEFNAEFIDDNTIGLATEGSNPLMSKRIYKRVQ